MVNYRYDPEQVVTNHEAFVQEGRIVMSRTLQREHDKHIRPSADGSADAAALRCGRRHAGGPAGHRRRHDHRADRDPAVRGQGLAHGLAIKMALGTSLATIVVTAISSIYTHHRKGAVDWKLFSTMGPACWSAR